MKLTLADVKNSAIPRVLGVCSTDPRLLQWLNEAIEVLLEKNLWKDTYWEYSICTTSACLTLPRQIQTVEGYQICNTPGIIRSQWFTFLGNSYGKPSPNNGYYRNWHDQGDRFCTFDDIAPTKKQVRLYPAYSSDIGKTMLLQGWDDNGNWILTNGGATEGELVTLALPFAQTAYPYFWASLTGVQKQFTAGPVRAFEKDTTIADPNGLRPLAYWEADEQYPQYRRALIPGLQNIGSCSNCCGDNVATPTPPCAATSVNVIAKARFIPVRNDTDWLLISSLPALKEMMLSRKRREDNLIAEAEAHEQVAVRILEEQLMSFIGHGTVQPFRVEDAALFGAGSIENLTGAYAPLSRY